jgi:hypothetical protein
MWAMANEDEPDLAKYFYKSMFLKKEKKEPVPYYKRSAGALRDEVKKLRKMSGEVGELRSLRGMICECIDFVGCGFGAYLLPVAVRRGEWICRVERVSSTWAWPG